MIGSSALEAHGVSPRVPKDIDLIATHDEVKAWVAKWRPEWVRPSHDGKHIACKCLGEDGTRQVYEFEVAWPGTTSETIWKAAHEAVGGADKVSLGRVVIPTMHLLLMLKMSHRFLKNSPHFNKTREDIKLLRGLGANVLGLEDLLAAREKETYTYAHPKLDVKKTTFFNPEQVPYTWDHDSIHRAMALRPGVPAYTFFQDGEVRVSKEKWDALPIHTKLCSVLEESYVLALERSQIPFRGKVSPKASFLMALEKVCTSISSGWWREFAWEHYDDVLGMYSDDYVGAFDRGVADGTILPYKEGDKHGD